MSLRRKMTYTTTVLAIFLFFCPKAYAHGSAFCKALVCNTVYVVLPSYYNTALSWSHGHAEEKKNCIGNYRIQDFNRNGEYVKHPRIYLAINKSFG